MIDNSVKYSDKAVTIRVSSERVNKGVVIRFWDNGFGIKKDDQKIIFDKFERASASNRMIKKGGASGFGMGLTYVFQVIDAHHGMVTVDSELGKYTEFTIFLPDQNASNGGGGRIRWTLSMKSLPHVWSLFAQTGLFEDIYEGLL